MGSLNGIKILDLTRVLAGPYATMVLGDMGAEIIKVEMPERGDDSRFFGPHINGESAYFMSINRNKKSMTLNLKTQEGKEILQELVKKCDVIVENFRPGTMEKLGLGYDEIRKVNPRIIYAASSGFGHSGPYSKRPAYDAVVQAMGGIMSITGHDMPTRVGASIGDITAGLFTTIGILSALYNRNLTGEGQKVDVAMLDCQVAILENAIARYLVSGEIPGPKGNRHPSIVPFENFETSDGEIMIAIGNDNLWKKFCMIAHREELIEDEKYKSNPLRNENYESLKIIMDKIMEEKTTEEWQHIFDEEGIPNSPINSVDKVIENEQVKSREMIVEVDHRVAGKTKIPGIPIKMSKTPGKIEKAAPTLGEHTKEILEKYLTYDEEYINELRNNGVI
ncbi:CaiB/BaiF CoA transferase family protein [Anaeromicrobium sediminis]|uniref:Carnitine dehydratase n=1 Tax=Anaeromicrobium sediminis TaxID=1478221 RepID=A0A267MCR1_9FIRM|nr:CaiB/BaiF CoA-transferase family protein [Anaeromicrobium sediminis]PAB57371.1 carnitine dehydratase [Anaeromicrobium sediminis]